MVGGSVDKQRFQRREEILHGIAGKNLVRSVLAEFRTQLGLHLRRAGHFNAAGFQPIEFGQETAACQRRQAPQIILDPFGKGPFNVVFARLVSGSTISPSRAGSPVFRCRYETTKTVRARLRSQPTTRGTTGPHVYPKRSGFLGRTAWICSPAPRLIGIWAPIRHGGDTVQF